MQLVDRVMRSGSGLLKGVGSDPTPGQPDLSRPRWKPRPWVRIGMIACTGCGVHVTDGSRIYAPFWSDEWGTWRGVTVYCPVCASRGDIVNVPCQVCGKSFEFVVDGRRRSGLFCSDRCRGVHQARERKEARQLFAHTCDWCQQKFQPTRKDALFCSSGCRMQFHRSKRRWCNSTKS